MCICNITYGVVCVPPTFKSDDTNIIIKTIMHATYKTVG